MQVPRDLGLTATGALCEWGVEEQDRVFRRKGQTVTPAEDRQYGVTAYLERTERAKILAEAKARDSMPEPEAKAVEQSEVEDKSVKGPMEAKADDEQERLPGVIFPPEARRQRGR